MERCVFSACSLWFHVTIVCQLIFLPYILYQDLFKQQQKLIQQQCVVHANRLKSLRNIHDQYTKGIKELERSQMDQQGSVQQELRQELGYLQKKILHETVSQVEILEETYMAVGLMCWRIARCILSALILHYKIESCSVHLGMVGCMHLSSQSTELLDGCISPYVGCCMGMILLSIQQTAVVL